MILIEWTDKLSVNIPIIDDQHKKLISYLNELYTFMKAGKGKEIVGETLSNLLEYTKYHFKTEEDLFNKFNYPEKITHEQEHKEFINKITKINDDFINGKLSISITLLTTAVIEVFQFLNQWILNHIMKTDKKYEAFLKAALKY